MELKALSERQVLLDYLPFSYVDARAGVFFLLAQGKLRVIRSQAALAIDSYEAAVKAQSQYRSLHYVSFWELAICNMAVWRLDESLKYWRYLQAEATWSKACYSYGAAVCLLQLGGDENAKKAGELMKEIPSLVHKIAGKSIPLEVRPATILIYIAIEKRSVQKFVSRKARKFQQQKGRLILPALEFSYVLLGIDHAPPTVIEQAILPSVNETLADLEANKSRQGFWDDICLARLLEGVCYRFLAYLVCRKLLNYVHCRFISNISQDEHAEKDKSARKPSLASRAEAAFLKVIEDGQNLELDHYILYNACETISTVKVISQFLTIALDYELGRLLVAMGRVAEGRKHLECVVSGSRLKTRSSVSRSL